MAANIITIEDLNHFKAELLEEIRNLYKTETQPPKKWLKSDEVKKMLHVSAGTLQTLRINGTLHFTKLGGIIYYDYDHILKTFDDNKFPAKKLIHKN